MREWSKLIRTRLLPCEPEQLAKLSGEKYLFINGIEEDASGLKRRALGQGLSEYLQKAGAFAQEIRAHLFLVLAENDDNDAYRQTALSSNLPILELFTESSLLLQEPGRLLACIERQALERGEDEPSKRTELRSAYAAVCDIDALPSLLSSEEGRLTSVFEFSGGHSVVPRGQTVEETIKSCNKDDYLQTVRAVILGYPQGCIVSKEALSEVRVDTASIMVLRSDECILPLLRSWLSAGAKVSCGWCVFCREGLRQAERILIDIEQKRSRPGDMERLRDLADTIAAQVNCKIGRTYGRLLQSALEQFSEELEQHISRKQCPKGSCAKYKQYYILPSLCIGCGECIEACEDDAIDGKRKYIHVIQSKSCSNCGNCADACPENAILNSGTLPTLPVRPVPCGSWRR